MFKFDIDVSVSEGGRKKKQYNIDTDLQGELTLQDMLEFLKTSLIVLADQALKEEQSIGFDKEPVLAVDGKVGKPITSVSPFGKIEFFARQNIQEIVLDAYDGLLKRSKVLTGRYKSSHYVFLNGKQVAVDEPSLKAWLATNPEIVDKDVIRIVNIQPYARKLERFGITAQRSSRRVADRRVKKKKVEGQVLVPNGTYFLTARSIRAKYKRNSSIRFTFIPGSSLGLSGAFKGGRKGRNSKGRPYLYPTIVIGVQERGIV